MRPFFKKCETLSENLSIKVSASCKFGKSCSKLENAAVSLRGEDDEAAVVRDVEVEVGCAFLLEISRVTADLLLKRSLSSGGGACQRSSL